ncbi:MAG: FAD-binding oxidoreductase [Gemmatimonadales bacterium]
MSDAIAERLRQVAGRVEHDEGGIPRALPNDGAEAAAVLGLAHAEGWRARVEGAGTWCPTDAPADLALATTNLTRIKQLAPGDLVATVEAGLAMTDLDRALAPHGVEVALDPPGAPERTLGSVLATATAGPRRQAVGPTRDHVLGLAVATGDGRAVRAGGTVVKNVAGYDLAKLAVGSFGAFGVITEASLRLRTRPARRLSMLVTGGFDPLFDAGRSLAGLAIDFGAIELASPGLTGGPDWTLAIQLAGTDELVASMAERVRAATPALSWLEARDDAARQLADALAQGALDGPVTLRLGALADAIPELLHQLGEVVPEGRLSAGLGRGGVRWTGEAQARAIGELRQRAAALEVPITLERAPWPVRRAAGHFGAYREGVGRLTAKLRDVFDPSRVLLVPLEAGDG